MFLEHGLLGFLVYTITLFNLVVTTLSLIGLSGNGCGSPNHEQFWLFPFAYFLFYLFIYFFIYKKE